MAHEINSVTEFLNHRAIERSGGFLSKWKKNVPPTVDVWLHRRRMPISLWQHQFPRLVPREFQGNSRIEVWGGTYNCHEEEDVLRKQYHRDRETDQRTIPPKRCPFCKLIEAVREMVEEGQLNWVQPLFRFEGDEDIRIIHAGGLYGAYGDELTDDEKVELREAGIKLTEAWKENSYAKMSYVFCVVDNKNVGGGVQIAIESNLLGDKVKSVINNTMKSLGAEKGNPFLNPYAIQWEHCPQEAEFNKKFDARRMELIPLTPAIDQLISSNPPDLRGVLAPFNKATMRALFERHCLVKDMPWDWIFEVEAGEEEEQEQFPPQQAAALPKNGAAVSPPPSADDMVCPECGPGKECPHVACATCEKPILETDARCKHCGHVYVAEPTPPPQPAPAATAGTGRKRAPSGKKMPWDRS